LRHYTLLTSLSFLMPAVPVKRAALNTVGCYNLKPALKAPACSACN
jgi:hypothetical protein